jgi:hypothetical protein
MMQAQPKKMKITLDVDTAKLDELVDNGGVGATEVTQAEIERIHNSANGFRFVGTILHTHSSPGCTYISIGGKTYKICT